MKIVALAFLMAVSSMPAMANENLCVDMNLNVDQERINLKNYRNLREALLTGSHTKEQMIQYLDAIIKVDVEYLDGMEKFGFPGDRKYR